jgi:hypothetical protein
MEEILYIVNKRRVFNGSNVTVVATLKKKDDIYTYKPYNLSIDTIPRAKKTVVSKGLPPIAQRRLYSKRRPDIGEILAKYGLSYYNEWELLKRTKGILATDELMYLTKEDLNTLRGRPEVLSFFDIEEAVALERVFAR